MVEPATHNYKIWNGTTWIKQIAWYTDMVLQTPQNLTGYSALMEIRSNPTDVSPLYSIGTSSVPGSTGSIALGGGTITLTIPQADIAGFTWANATYHLYVTDGSGNRSVLLYGGIAVVTV